MKDTVNICWPGWETVKLIGRGSFGVVYEIQRSVGNWIEKAALKIISIPQNNSDIEELYSDGYDEESITSTFKSYLQSILEEYSLMKKMSGCANIVHCDDVRYIPHDDGIGWDVLIKMELLTPLTKTLSDNIAEETVVKLAKDMCLALEECKKYNIIHRDIKPQNIFVSETGDYKLGDFGIAKTVEKTMGGTKIGTYKYMAPEVYKSQPYGSAADIYSLGLVLYWMLNERRMPFMPLDSHKMTVGMDEEARQRRLSGEIIPPPAHGREELKKIVLKACSYNPTDRYKNPSEMRIALENLSNRKTGHNPSDGNSKSYDVHTFVWLCPSDVINGCTKSIAIKETGKTLCVDIPAGIKDGQKIRLRGCGKENLVTGIRGNVYLTVKILYFEQNTSNEIANEITADEIEKTIPLYSCNCKRDSETIEKVKNIYKIPAEESIYFVIDYSVFGSCKSGIAIGKQGIYFKYGWETGCIMLQDSKQYRVLGITGKTITIRKNGDKPIDLTFFDKCDKENIRLLLESKGIV